MPVKIFRHDTTNAPVLSGNINAAIDVLDACLVNGWALPTVSSITRVDSTATITFASAHGFKHKTHITISGANESDYNGSVVVTPTTTTQATYTVNNAPATPATGTITASMTSAGWAKAFSSTNVAVYRAATGTRHYCRIDDTALSTSFRLVGYETMSDHSTGTGAFPTSTQMSGGLYGFKSDSASSTAKSWAVIASEKWFYFYACKVSTLEASTAFEYTVFFGEIDSLLPGDSFNTLIIGGNTSTTLNTQLGSLSSSISALTAHYMPRGVAQTGTSIQYSKTADTRGSLSNIGTLGAAYPDVVTGGMLLSPVYVCEPSTYYSRGLMPRMYAPLHNLPGNPGDTFTGRGALAGKDFILLDAGSSTTRGRVVFDITP